jgi:alkaline phosphatase D
MPEHPSTTPDDQPTDSTTPTSDHGADDAGRRRFLSSVASATIGGGLAAILGGRELARPVQASDLEDPNDGLAIDERADPDAVFPQSVMSGGPTPSGAIAWTRLDPDAAASDSDLVLQVATDPALDDVVYQGRVPGDQITAAHDHTVQVDLDGELAPDAFYHYRFVYEGTATRTGRLRTLPAADASPDSVSFAVVTCQDYQNGYYGAFHHIAQEDVDYVVHMGDLIYESADGAYISPTGEVPDDRQLTLPSGADLAESLDDFRYLYNQYKQDSLFQETLEQHTMIAGWDDHEIGNNRYWDYAADAPVLPDKDGGSDPEFAMELTANGIQAWVEHLPMRVDYDPDAEHLQDQLRLWRQLEFGDLVDLAITDERLFRDGPPCEDGETVTCTKEEAEGRSILGDEQKQWWYDWTENSSAKWTTWVNEVLTMPLTKGDGYNQIEFLLDSWDGFQYERWELMDHLQRNGPRNFVTLTGDLHAAMVGYQQEAYGEVDWEWWYDDVGVEFMTPSVTSVNAADVVDFPGDWDAEVVEGIAKEQNEHLEFLNFFDHGYAVVEFTRDEARYTAWGVDIEENSPDADREKLAEYTTPDGEVDLVEQYEK